MYMYIHCTVYKVRTLYYSIVCCTATYIVCTLYCSICTSTCTLYCSVHVYSMFKNVILQVRASILNLPILTVDCIYLSCISRLFVMEVVMV